MDGFFYSSYLKITGEKAMLHQRTKHFVFLRRPWLSEAVFINKR